MTGHPPSRKRLALTLTALGAISAFGPISMDLYLPGMPSIAADLGASDTLAQATMSACMVGLALGQLVYGPWSDRSGRRIPLLIGVGAFVLLSLLCAIAPTIELLLIARFLQGFAGAAGLVISRAVVRDLFQGHEMARVFSLLMAITGVAPVIAPLGGAALLLFVDWRGVFIALGVLGLGIFILSWFAIPESLQQPNRETGGFTTQIREMGRTVRIRSFMTYAMVSGLSGAALFTYISMSSIVFQDDFGLSPQLFAVLFAINSVGIVVGSQLNSVLTRRYSLHALAIAGLVIGSLAASSVAFAALAGLALIVLLVPLFVATFVQGGIIPDISAIALEPFARGAGAAAAILGTSQFLLGALIPPLVSLGGTSAVVMGVTIMLCMTSALALMLIQVRVRRRAARAAVDAQG
jgi:DHA1 family bicyclomycin/chloramphenicol resistance-like MFS transporter